MRVEQRRFFDQARGHAGDRLSPGGRAGIQLAFDLPPAARVLGQEASINAAGGADGMQHGEGERAIRAGIKLQMDIGRRRRFMPDGIDHDLRRARLRKPVLVHVWRRRRGICTPDHQALGGVDGARIKPTRRFPVHELQRRVSRLVAHRVGVDLGGADAVEEPQGKNAGDQRACAGVVRLQDGRAAVAGADGIEASSDGAERLVPARRLELACTLAPDPLQGARQPHVRVAPHPVVGDRAFAAQRAASELMLGIADDGDRAAGRGLHQDAAGVIAVARTSRADCRVVHRRASPSQSTAPVQLCAWPLPSRNTSAMRSTI